MTGFHFSAVTHLGRPETQVQFSPEIGLQIRPEVSSLYCGVAQVMPSDGLCLSLLFGQEEKEQLQF